jgi:hypothetical protein
MKPLGSNWMLCTYGLGRFETIQRKGTPLNGSWTASDEASKFTYNPGPDTYTKR